MTLALLEMFLEALLQLGVRSGFCHFRQRFENLIFRAVKVPQFLGKQIIQRFQLHDLAPFKKEAV